MADVMTFLPRQELLSLEEIDQLASAFVARGVRKLRLTGGEPLVRRNIMWLIESLSRHLGKGLDELTLTTNGSQLSVMPTTRRLRRGGPQRAAGYADAAKFRTITRIGDFSQVMGARRGAAPGSRSNQHCGARDVNEDDRRHDRLSHGRLTR